MSSIVGIDIGQSTVKIACISDDNSKIVLNAIGESKIPKTENKEINRDKFLIEVGKEIKGLLGDLKIKSKQTVVSLPENEVMSRLVRLPPLKDSEIMDALRFEAETFVPFPLDQVSIDYEVIEKDDAGRLNIFVIAAKNDLINSYLKLFKSIGLELLALESPSNALRRVLKLGTPMVERVVVVDIGEKYSDISSINKSNVYFSRPLSVGGESLTRAISLNLSLDMASAEEYKKAYGMKESELEGKIRAAIMPVFNDISEEIRKTLALFNEDIGKPAELLILTGGGANLPGMAEELTKILGIEVQVLQPFVNIDTTKVQSVYNLNTEGCRFSLSVGLALRSLI
ncbi:MAG: type IV pilus assembly protein PilM [Candidatus Shapirobacteria bacterium]|nr:type IV pilus assembly protein PilM [Candidatus Shapirobacteria bacterium]MDD3002330.1 type IV pilus assembly protein PilM [Candidatus Shapirobacteria bacterium]MDD4382665.1 type IV pilus assembly protein PilM [Candidatus Shapirobacteria bacterium]